MGLLRNGGALIIHSPSSPDTGYVSNYYKTTTDLDEQQARARGRASVTDDVTTAGGGSTRTRENYYSIDELKTWDDFFMIVAYSSMSKGGQEPTRQHPGIKVHAKDVLCADGLDDGLGSNLAYQQLLGLTANRPNLIYCGVHTNQCILRRHNGMRTMHRAGKSLWLVRDLTDCVSTPNEGLVHFGYTDTVVDWIGSYLGAATKTTEEAGILGRDHKPVKQFQFQGDDRTNCG